MNGFLTWEYLGTFAGAVAITTILVQFFKLQADKVWKIPTRYIVYLISVIILFAYQIFNGSLELENIVLTLLNAVVVSMASMGLFDNIKKELAK